MLKGPRAYNLLHYKVLRYDQKKRIEGTIKTNLSLTNFCLTILYVVQETEDIEEEVDEIEVEAN